MQVEALGGVCRCATPGTIAEGGEEDVSGPAIGTVLSAGIVDVFSDEVVNAADLDADAAPAAWAKPDPPGRAIGRFWLAVAAAALVTGAYAAQVVVPAAETSPAPIAGIAPSYGPKTVSAVPNAAAIAPSKPLAEPRTACRSTASEPFSTISPPSLETPW